MEQTAENVHIYFPQLQEITMNKLIQPLLIGQPFFAGCSFFHNYFILFFAFVILLIK